MVVSFLLQIPHYCELFLVLVARFECQMSYYFILSSARNCCRVVEFRLLDSVRSLIHILSKPDIICMRISPNSADVTRPRQGITTWLSY